MDTFDNSNVALLVVGAGGIGCELLKNLVLSNFLNITVIDLDTIDVSNLNRQFLFRKEHVGKSKAEVAKNSVLKFNPKANIRAIHGSIIHEDYGVDFFRQFSIVLNALDNNAARRHVNRLCIATGVPLIESGSRGYLGQVYPILKGLGPCYECTPQAPQKTYPACTIRNTPTEPIHCVVWAKYLFNQLYGEEDPDADVAPYLMSEETTDKENGTDAPQPSGSNEGDESLATASHDYHIPLRTWYRSHSISQTDVDNGSEEFHVEHSLMHRLFHDDIVYLLSMKDLWKDRGDRKKPTPMKDLLNEKTNNNGHQMAGENGDGSKTQLRDQRLLSLHQWSQVFCESVHTLAKRVKAESIQEEASKKEATLIWDKDDEVMMDFVAAAANLRLNVFHMESLTRFQVKSMAGNIVPAIATTNGVVAGLIVLEAMKVLQNRKKECRDNFLHCAKTARGKFILGCTMNIRNPHCAVCSDERPQILLYCMPGALNSQLTVQVLKQDVLRRELGMMVPEVVTDTGAMIISADEEETQSLMPRPLAEVKVKHGTNLACSDDVQQYSLQILVEELHDGAPVLETFAEHERVTLAEKRFFVRVQHMSEETAENGATIADSSTGAASGVKRSAESAEDGAPAAKRQHVEESAELEAATDGKVNNEEVALVVEEDDLVMGDVLLPV